MVTEHLKHHTDIWMESQGLTSSYLCRPSSHTNTNARSHTHTHTDKGTYAIYSRDLEVINQLNYHVLVGVAGVALSHLKDKMKQTWQKEWNGRTDDAQVDGYKQTNSEKRGEMMKERGKGMSVGTWGLDEEKKRARVMDRGDKDAEKLIQFQEGGKKGKGGERKDEEMKEEMVLRKDKTIKDSQTLKCQIHQTLTHRSSLISSRAVSV